MTIGERIKQKRIELDLSQDELAKRVGYKSRSSIQKIESARNLPLRKVELMARALGVSKSYLMGWDDIGDIMSADVEIEPNPAIDRFYLAKSEIGALPSRSLSVSVKKERLMPYTDEQIDTAMKLYDMYRTASPEIQAAIETLLKAQAHDS